MQFRGKKGEDSGIVASTVVILHERVILMNSRFKAWRLACMLHWFIKMNDDYGATGGMTEKGIKDSEAMKSRAGTDPRTQEKYFEIMQHAGYLVPSGLNENKVPIWNVVEDIEERRPKSPSELLREYKARATGKPIPEQKQLN